MENQKTDTIATPCPGVESKSEFESGLEEERVIQVIFTMADAFYAFYGRDVKEILPYNIPTPVPGCPDHIIGIINVRGDIESVLNLRKLMRLDAQNPGKQSRIIMAAHEDIRSGILVDSVEDVIEIPVSAIKKPISTLEKNVRDFALGGEMVYKEQYVTLLDVGKLFGRIVP